jgi:hypothetical protein
MEEWSNVIWYGTNEMVDLRVENNEDYQQKVKITYGGPQLWVAPSFRVSKPSDVEQEREPSL